MKLSQRQQILKHAEAHPEGFKAADLAYTGITPSQIAHKLWDMKHKKILKHNRKTHTYKLMETNSQTIKVTAPKAKPVQKPITQERKDEALKVVDNMLKEVIETGEKYQDALAIIRYLENKLLIAIQHDARSRS